MGRSKNADGSAVSAGDFIWRACRGDNKGWRIFWGFLPLQLEECAIEIQSSFIDACNGIEYEDVYYLDLDKVSGRSNGREQGSVEVKHAISFQNSSGQPLTTAPVSILTKTEDNNNKPMVQGMMKYTGPGKKATVEITRTLDVEGKFVVETKERKTEVLNEAENGKLESKKQYVDSIQTHS